MSKHIKKQDKQSGKTQIVEPITKSTNSTNLTNLTSSSSELVDDNDDIGFVSVTAPKFLKNLKNLDLSDIQLSRQETVTSTNSITNSDANADADDGGGWEEARPKVKKEKSVRTVINLDTVLNTGSSKTNVVSSISTSTAAAAGGSTPYSRGGPGRGGPGRGVVAGKMDYKKATDPTKTVYYDIKMWALSGKPLDELVAIYNRNKAKWEDQRFRRMNIRYVINESARAWRHDILKYLRENNPLYTPENYVLWASSPYHKMVWPDEKDVLQASYMVDEDIERIKLTFQELQNCGMFVFMLNKREDEGDESFIGALNGSTNPMPEKYKNQLYYYFTEEWYDESQAVPFLNSFLNWVDCRPARVIDKILFFCHKYNDIAISRIFNWTLNMDIVNGSEDDPRVNVHINQFVNVFMADPVQTMDMYKYLITKDIQEIRLGYLNYILTNYERSIHTLVRSKVNYTGDATNFAEYFKNFELIEGEDEIDEVSEKIMSLKKHFYKNLMIMTGCFYAQNLGRVQILEFINQIMASESLSVEHKVDCILDFLQNSRINPRTANPIEASIISDFLKNFWQDKGKLQKIQIKTCFNKIMESPKNLKDDEIRALIIN